MNITLSAREHGWSKYAEVCKMVPGQTMVTRRAGWVRWAFEQWDLSWTPEIRAWTDLSKAEQLEWKAAYRLKPHATVQMYWRPRIDVSAVLETLEFTHRNGPRLVCSVCGWLGPTSPDYAVYRCPHDGFDCEYRLPREGPQIVITEPLRREPLAEMALEELRLEGLGHWIEPARDRALRREVFDSLALGRMRTTTPELLEEISLRFLVERFARLVLKRKRLRPGDLETSFTRIPFQRVAS